MHKHMHMLTYTCKQRERDGEKGKGRNPWAGSVQKRHSTENCIRSFDEEQNVA